MALNKLLYTLIVSLVTLCGIAGNVVLPPTFVRDSSDDNDKASMVFADEHIVNKHLLSNTTITFESDGALSMHAWISGIDRDLLDSIVIENKYGRHIYTAEYSFKNDILTDILGGNTIGISYYGKQDFVIVREVYTGFLPLPWIEGPRNKVLFNISKSCEKNASCYSQADVIKRSVCRLLISNEVGTGSLINNTNEDLAPYVLTSAHPLVKHILYNKPVNVLFGWEIQECDATQRPSETIQNMETILMDTLLCYNPEYDLALLALTNTPTEARNPYWSGWDISGNVDEYDEYSCVHHPAGDVKKVSIGTNVVLADYTLLGLRAPDGNISFKKNAHYKVGTWLVGTTEGGSSGSALWNSDNKIIGALSGGQGDCSNLGDDYFWSLSLAWNASYKDYKTLHEILDPQNYGIKALSGRDLYTKENNLDDVLESNEISVIRNCGSITVVADTIKEIIIYTLDGKVVYSMKYDKQNQAEINTVPWTNKLIVLSVKYGINEEKRIKVFTK